MRPTVIHLAAGGVRAADMSEASVIGLIQAARARGVALEIERGEITGDAASEATLGAVADWLPTGERGAYMEAMGLTLAPSVIAADADTYAPRALVDLRDRPFKVPHVPMATLRGLPIDRTLAAPDAMSYQWQYEAVEGDVSISRDGQAVGAPTELDRTFSAQRPVFTYTATVSENWLRTMLDRRASPGAAGRRQAGAQSLIRRRLSKVLAAGLPGHDVWSLANVPALRTVSPLDYGDAATTSDAIMEDITRFLDRVEEAGDGAFAAPNCVMFTQRHYNRIRQRWDRATGVSAGLGPTLKAELEGRGMTVKINNELKGIGDGNRDLVVAFYDPAMGPNGQTEESDLEAAALRHALAMDIAPVHRWTDGGGTKILFALRTGHLCVPHAGAVVAMSVTV